MIFHLLGVRPSRKCGAGGNNFYGAPKPALAKNRKTRATLDGVGGFGIDDEAGVSAGSNPPESIL